MTNAPAPETVVPKSVSEPKIAPLVIETEAVKPVPVHINRHGRQRLGPLNADSLG